MKDYVYCFSVKATNNHSVSGVKTEYAVSYIILRQIDAIYCIEGEYV